VVGEFEASLAMVTLSVILPVAEGANVTFRVTTWPGVIISPFEMPEALKPEPANVTLETVMLTAPEFVKVTLWALLLLTITLPKLKLAVLGVSAPGVAALTVSIAALLVMLPTESLTTTVNCAPLSEEASAGVM